MKNYNVTGMSCAACSSRVEKAVSAVEGVTSCSVSLLTNSMGVEGAAPPEKIIAAVESAGYGASLKGAEAKKQTKYPLTRKQIESLCCLNAYLSIKYGIIVDEKSVFTHYEFDQRRQKKLREGKIDITYIHYLPNLSANSIGNYLRQKISWYKEKIKQGKYTFTKKGDYYEFLAKV